MIDTKPIPHSMDTLLSLVKRRSLSIVQHDKTTLEEMTKLDYTASKLQPALQYGFFAVDVTCHLLYKVNDRNVQELRGVFLPNEKVAVIGKSEKEFLSFLGNYHAALRSYVRPFYKGK
jgi:hypothetical protein